MRAPKAKGLASPESRLLNRELSWIDFDRRVLAEAVNPANPILERLKFLAIVESNLDEFFMVRVSGLVEQHEHGVAEMSPDGLTPLQQISEIIKATRPLRKKASETWEQSLRPALDQAGIHLRKLAALTPKQRQWVSDYFDSEIFPLCTPLLMYPATTV